MQSDMDYAEKMYSLFQRFLQYQARTQKSGGGGGGRTRRVGELGKKPQKKKFF